MADRLGDLLRDAADADLGGVELTRPDQDGTARPEGRTRTGGSTRWFAAAAVLALVVGAGWWASRPDTTAVRVGDDSGPSTTSSGRSPSDDLAAALAATMSSAWNALLSVEGSDDIVRFAPPNAYRAEYGDDQATVWIGDRAWDVSGGADVAAREVEDPNPFARLLASLGAPRSVERRPDGALAVGVDPESCTGASGATIGPDDRCTLVVRLDGDWIARIEVPGWVNGAETGETVVLELTPAESLPVIEAPDAPASTTTALAVTEPCTLIVTLAADAPRGTAERVGDTLKQRTEQGGDAASPERLAESARQITGVASVLVDSSAACAGALGIDIRPAR